MVKVSIYQETGTFFNYNTQNLYFFLGGIMTNSVDPQPTQNLRYDLPPVQYIELTHQLNEIRGV